ncbi:MAG: hypothetical protein E6K99_06625 [Thaumarchaeota archaeon]|nr:MAG: hypothetical protein E6K99_06625 [Nitrososphaerota archaeon]
MVGGFSLSRLELVLSPSSLRLTTRWSTLRWVSRRLLTTGAAYSISSTRDKLGSDVLGGSLIQKTHLEATVSSSFFAPAGGASTKGDRHWRVIPVGKFVQIGADSPIVC